MLGRDMFLNIPSVADWHVLTRHREQLFHESLRRQNLKRQMYDYIVGQQLLKKVHDPTKLGERTEGTSNIATVHVNRTMSIQLSPSIVERINIRRVIPYRGT